MAVTTLATPPSLADARRAAEAVAVEGVSRVLLFGSLARGEQTPESDIDLVAIFDDLDYRTRWRRKVELEKLARSAVGYPVEVRVTDWPEWAVRSEVVTTSFECRIAADAVVLRDGEPQGVNWRKEIGLPATNQEEAVASLENTTTALILLEGHLEPSSAERDALEVADRGSYLYDLSVRMRGVCGQAQLVTENSLKALIHHGGGEKPPRIHHLEEMIEKLSAGERAAAAELFADIVPADASLWRQRGTYPADYPEIALEELVPLAHRMATVATRLARLAADRISPAPGQAPVGTASPIEGLHPSPNTRATADRTRRSAGRIDEALNKWNLSAGSPTAILGCPPPPEPHPGGLPL